MSTERVKLKVTPLHSAYESLCVVIDGKEHYLPYSQIEDKKYGDDGMLCSLTIPKWLAKARKLL